MSSMLVNTPSRYPAAFFHFYYTKISFEILEKIAEVSPFFQIHLILRCCRS